MALEIVGVVDITDDVLDSSEQSSESKTYGRIARRRTFRLKDALATYNPFVPSSIFSGIKWRALSIRETDDLTGDILFEGDIKKVEPQETGRDGKITVVVAEEPIVSLLTFDVEATSNDSTRQVDGAQPAGNNSVLLKNGAADIAFPALISFNPDLRPRYFIADTVGTFPNQAVVLDRGLEEDLADSQATFVRTPQIDTVPSFIKAILVNLGKGDKLLSGFDSLDVEEASLGHSLVAFVPNESQVDVRTHLSSLLTLGGFLLLTLKDGTFDLIRDFGYRGQALQDEITENEILNPKGQEDDKNLIIGYELIYQQTKNLAAISEGNVDSNFIQNFRGTEFWQPQDTGSTDARDHKYLYGTEAFADYVGDARLLYYREPKKQIVCDVKQSKHNSPGVRFDIQRGREFLLTIPFKSIFDDVYSEKEVVRVVSGGNYDSDRRIYRGVVFELINNPVPALEVPSI